MDSLPALPNPDALGHYPARETLRAIIARKIIERRRAAGLTQGELADPCRRAPGNAEPPRTGQTRTQCCAPRTRSKPL